MAACKGMAVTRVVSYPACYCKTALRNKRVRCAKTVIPPVFAPGAFWPRRPASGTPIAIDEGAARMAADAGVFGFGGPTLGEWLQGWPSWLKLVTVLAVTGAAVTVIRGYPERA